MKWEYFGTGLTFLGIGITLVLALPPPWWPNMPRWAVRVGLVSGLALIVYGAAFTAMGIWPQMLRPKLLPILVVCLGASILVAGIVWLFRVQQPAKSDHEARTIATPGILLDFANDVFPRVAPPEGTIHLFDIVEESGAIRAGLVEHLERVALPILGIAHLVDRAARAGPQGAQHGITR